MTTLVLPGLIDAHVHLREPGSTHKEGILSGTSAALAGGVLGILDMPNNTPPTVNRLAFARKSALFSQKAVSDYGLFLGFDGTDFDALTDVAPLAVGLKLYLDQTFGDMTMRDSHLLAAVFEAWPGPGPIAIHAESATIVLALDLAKRCRQRLHICHVPHPDDLARIADARQRGVAVTCEITPHHLFLCQDDELRLGAYGRMKPPLVSATERERFWQQLDQVDLIASDHAPHTRAEKESVKPPPGVPGLETTLPLLLNAVDQDRLTLERLLELVWHAPLRVYGLAAPSDSCIEVTVEQPYCLPSRGYHTRCGWTPFAGQTALGCVTRVRLRGQTVWEDGKRLAPPGYGQPLVRVDSPLSANHNSGMEVQE